MSFFTWAPIPLGVAGQPPISNRIRPGTGRRFASTGRAGAATAAGPPGTVTGRDPIAAPGAAVVAAARPRNPPRSSYVTSLLVLEPTL